VSRRYALARAPGGGLLVPTLALALALAAGCASTPSPKTVAVAATPPPVAEAGKAEEPKLPPTVVVIDKGGAAQPRSLAEASRAEKTRRQKEGKRPQIAVITDKNLADYAAKGEVTVATPAPPTAGSAAAKPADAGGAAPKAGETAATTTADTPSTTAADGAGGPRDESYWRTRARDIRQRWHQAADEVTALEKESADLRWKFYAEDDAYYRDQQIKPQWDRVLDDLRRARQDVRSYQRELADFQDEGRRAGALPGWLRDGIELEPEPAADKPAPKQPPDHQSIEPPVVDEPSSP
jgi:hypothetical protein